jgi:FkbM family methyltransferase
MRVRRGRAVNVFQRKLTGIRLLWHFDNRWTLIADRLLRPGGSVSTYRYGQLRIEVDHAAGDANGVREVFATPMYRDLLATTDLDGSVRVLDIGAHIGSFTLLLVALGFDVTGATCVEMNAHTAARLRRNLETNLPGRANAIRAAVCGDGIDRIVSLGTGDTGDSLEHGSPTVDGTSLQHVPGTTIDRLLADFVDPVDICKLDVEGAEYAIFGQPNHATIRRCRYLLIEVHDHVDHDPEHLLSHLHALGFEATTGARDAVGVHLFRNTATTDEPRSQRA